MIEQFIKFCIVGGSGVLVDFGVTYSCKERARLNKYIASSLGFIVAATTNYLLNRFWTFQSTNSMPAEYLKFIGISVMGLGLNNVMIYLLTEKMRVNFYFSKLLAIGVVTVWNFLMSYFFTFNPMFD